MSAKKRQEPHARASEAQAVNRVSSVNRQKPVVRHEIRQSRGMTREERTQEVMAMMRRDEWCRGKTGPALAKSWGMAPTSLEEIAAEASRRVLAEIRDPDRLQAKGLSRIEKIADDSMVEAQDADEPHVHRKVALDAYSKLLVLAGAAADQRGPLDWGSLSTAEKWKRIDEAQARIDAVKATLPPRAKELGP